jgi:CHAD domain-containing protein
LWAKLHHTKKLAKSDNEERHRLRILIKKLRYALEFAEGLHGHAAEQRKKFANAVQDLQEALGHLNDAVVARTLVATEQWLIEPRELTAEERAFLDGAEQNIGYLREIGPYWRRTAG